MRTHTVTLVDTTAWLFGGGDLKESSRDVFCFDTEIMQWTRPDTTGETPPPSRAHTATLVYRNIVVYGGRHDSTYHDSTYVLDTITRRWSRPLVTGPIPPARCAHTSVHYQGKVYVFASANPDSSMGTGMAALDDLWTLDVSDLAKLHWQKLEPSGPKPTARGYHTANLIGNVMVVIGGSDGNGFFDDIWCLNLDALRWIKLIIEKPHRRLGHSSTQVGSYLFIFGGHDGDRYMQTLLLFNLASLATLAIEERGTLGKAPRARGYHVTLLAEGRLFLFGGYDGARKFNEVHLLDAPPEYFPQVTHFALKIPE
ncbi:galactose oxidase [Mycena metata]|uniref:Galactose oxidase n=1 Tax=Mycena metata TaxID=1033252 RepID=A0AAD7HJ83_9AGAR|nr:galactose oxidase [Mycena metata]